MGASVRSRVGSVLCALSGIRTVVREERNGKVLLLHAPVSTIAALAAGLPEEMALMLFLASMIAFAAECVNTAVERMVNMCRPWEDQEAGMVKDLSSGAVALTCFPLLVMDMVVIAQAVLE